MARLACRVQELESAAVAQQKEKKNLAARGRASAAAAARSAAELAGARQAWRQREGEMDAQRKELQAHVGSSLCLLLIGLLRRFCCGTIFFGRRRRVFVARSFAALPRPPKPTTPAPLDPSKNNR
jgi:hypothetical protein